MLGSGTKSQPYLIENWEDFNVGFRNILLEETDEEVYFCLTTDIYSPSTNALNFENFLSFISKRPFHLDGKFFTIYNITNIEVGKDDNRKTIGGWNGYSSSSLIFYEIKNSTIKNIKFKKCFLSTNIVTCSSILCNYSENCTFQNLMINGSLSGTATAYKGISTSAYNCTYINCLVDCVFSCPRAICASFVDDDYFSYNTTNKNLSFLYCKTTSTFNCSTGVGFINRPNTGIYCMNCENAAIFNCNSNVYIFGLNKDTIFSSYAHAQLLMKPSSIRVCSGRSNYDNYAINYCLYYDKELLEKNVGELTIEEGCPEQYKCGVKTENLKSQDWLEKHGFSIGEYDE